MLLLRACVEVPVLTFVCPRRLDCWEIVGDPHNRLRLLQRPPSAPIHQIAVHRYSTRPATSCGPKHYSVFDTFRKPCYSDSQLLGSSHLRSCVRTPGRDWHREREQSLYLVCERWD